MHEGEKQRISLKNTQSSSSADPSPSSSLIGTTFAKHYVIEELIGTGGWDNVYRAVHQDLNREVAITFLHYNQALSEHNFKRFQREAKLLSSLDHPNICRIIDYSTTAQNQPVIIMELASGSSLRELMQRGERLSAEETIEVSSQVCAAVCAAEDINVVHRDISTGPRAPNA